MFMDFREEWQPGGEDPQPRPKAQLTKRGEKVVTLVVVANAFLLFVAPIGGVTMLQPLLHWLLR